YCSHPRIHLLTRFSLLPLYLPLSSTLFPYTTLFRAMGNNVQAAPIQVPQQQTPEQPKTSAPVEEGKVIKAPMVGTFYKAASPEADAYVKVGDKVDNTSVVCILEAMKLFNEIQAEI